jgi:hypothetical protein
MGVSHEAMTGAGQCRPSDGGLLGVPDVMSYPPGVTADRFAIYRTCQLKGRRLRCGSAWHDGDAETKGANVRRSAIAFPMSPARMPEGPAGWPI